jgi:hypothetical protein
LRLASVIMALKVSGRKLQALRDAKTRNTSITWKELLLSDVIDGVDAFGGRVFPGATVFENENAVGEEGRFTSEDPARDGLNWYIYCYNNPLAFVDPSGLDPVTSPNYKKDPSGGLDRLRALAIIKKDRPKDELVQRYLRGISAGASAIPVGAKKWNWIRFGVVLAAVEFE